MYLYLAIFWLVIGVIIQIYWDVLQEYANFRFDRSVMGVFFFVLFSYNLIRWRLRRIGQWKTDDPNPPPKPRVEPREYDPNLDFTKPDNRPK